MSDFDDILRDAEANLDSDAMDMSYLTVTAQPRPVAQRGGAATPNAPVAVPAEQAADHEDAVIDAQEDAAADAHADDLEEAAAEQAEIEEDLDEALEDAVADAYEDEFEHHEDQLDIEDARKSDQRDEIAREARGGGGEGSAADGDGVLPSKTAFAVVGQLNPPEAKRMPDQLLDAIRERLIDTAVRELDVAPSRAKIYVAGLSQTALVLAMLMSQLDVRLDVDRGTGFARDLLRLQDPQLGLALKRLDELLRVQDEQRAVVNRLVGRVADVQRTATVIEQAVAYSIADRTENLARGDHSVEGIPLGDKRVITVRNRARDEADKRRRLEAAQEGRPIR